ncbi:MAG: SET domain-containing protein [Candidatus Peribacteraceae bacterium]|nr:SET domain-containing protein [Candidatus Peribacteraceae bacterium]
MSSATSTDSLRSSTDEFSFALKPSAVAGVGVFAVHSIRKGTELKLFPEEESRRIPRDASFITPFLREHFFESHCVVDGDTYHCPPDFRRMAIGWYLNHAETPNAFHKDYVYFARRDILAGEEITIDYESLGPDNHVTEERA